jgi:hypothetical protein
MTRPATSRHRLPSAYPDSVQNLFRHGGRAMDVVRPRTSNFSSLRRQKVMKGGLQCGKQFQSDLLNCLDSVTEMFPVLFRKQTAPN